MIASGELFKRLAWDENPPTDAPDSDFFERNQVVDGTQADGKQFGRLALANQDDLIHHGLLVHVLHTPAG